MIVLQHLAAARLSGPDASVFLHSQLAADIRALLPGQSTLAAYCSPKGQVIGLLLVGRENDDWIIIAAADLLGRLVQRLKMFVVRSQVHFQSIEQIQVIGLTANECPADSSPCFRPLPSGPIYSLGDQAGLEPDHSRLSQWRCDEIRHGICWLSTATSERFIPQMLGLDAIGAVSFSKGCYPGQEIIARTRYLGQLKRKPIVLEVDIAMDSMAGAACILVTATDQVPGTIIEHAALTADKTLLLAVAALEHDCLVQAVQTDASPWPARRVPIGK